MRFFVDFDQSPILGITKNMGIMEKMSGRIDFLKEK